MVLTAHAEMAIKLRSDVSNYFMITFTRFDIISGTKQVFRRTGEVVSRLQVESDVD